MGNISATRRTFFGFLGAAPIAAKAAADAEIAKGMNLTLTGLGDASLRLHGGSPLVDQPSQEACIPYEKRLIGAADYVKAFGIPASVDSRMRDDARYVHCLDPDIACKTSWSMSVKIMTQRQRNYDRAVERIKAAGWQERGRQTLKKFLGFDWPW